MCSPHKSASPSKDRRTRLDWAALLLRRALAIHVTTRRAARRTVARETPRRDEGGQGPDARPPTQLRLQTKTAPQLALAFDFGPGASSRFSGGIRVATSHDVGIHIGLPQKFVLRLGAAVAFATRCPTEPSLLLCEFAYAPDPVEIRSQVQVSVKLPRHFASCDSAPTYRRAASANPLGVGTETSHLARSGQWVRFR